MTGTFGFAQRLGDIGDCADLRHTHPSDDTGGTNRPWPYAHLHRISARFHQITGGGGGRDIAANDLYFGIMRVLIQRTRSSTLREWPCAVSTTITSISGTDQRRDPLFGITPVPTAAPTRNRPHSSLQASGEIAGFLDILDRDHAAQLKAVIDDQHFFNAIFVQQFDDFFTARPFSHGHQALLRGHDGADRRIQIVSNRKSRLVTIPTRSSPSTTGTPEI
jgi:hypothetical protein